MEDDEYNIDLSAYSTADTITINTSTLDSNYYTVTDSMLSISGLDMSDTIDLNDIHIYQPVEFEDEMPSVAKVEDMCREYPALEKAYETFKTVYKLVHQDWQGKQDEDNDRLF